MIGREQMDGLGSVKPCAKNASDHVTFSDRSEGTEAVFQHPVRAKRDGSSGSHRGVHKLEAGTPSTDSGTRARTTGLAPARKAALQRDLSAPQDRFYATSAKNDTNATSATPKRATCAPLWHSNDLRNISS